MTSKLFFTHHHHRFHPHLHFRSPSHKPLLPLSLPKQHKPHSMAQAPTEPKARTQTWLDLSSLWIGLIDLGMSSSQALSTVFLANLLLIIPLFLTAHPGIPSPVLARSSFGIHGSNVVTVMRGLVGCGWFGIESWIGGQAIYVLLLEKLTSMLPYIYIYWLGTSGVEFLCLLVFWGLQLGIVWRGMEGVRVLERFSAPVLIVLTVALLGWVTSMRAGSGMCLRCRRGCRGRNVGVVLPVFDSEY